MPAREAGREAGPRDERSLGPRALRTRRRLLDATAELLAERPLRDLAVVEIARRAETSPATFYQYFSDASGAVLALAGEATERMAGLLEAMPTEFDGPEGLGRARGFVAAFLDVWDQHHAVLRVRNHAAEEGDRRFRRLRSRALRPLLERLAQVYASAHGARGGRGGRGRLHPYAAAAAVATVLESLAAYHRELLVLGVGREDLVETSARLLVDTLTSGAP